MFRGGWTDLNEHFLAHEWSDGLPIVPPTRERIEAFLAYLHAERNLSPNTVSAYRNDLQQFADFLESEAQRQGGKDFALASIDRDLISAYFLHLRVLNRKPSLLEEFDPVRPLSPPDVVEAVGDGAWLIDGRPVERWAAARVPSKGGRPKKAS